MDKYIAFIPVRGGSKSIPLKNIKMIAGMPLVCWTVDAAAKTEKIDKVYIATDSDAIRDVVEKFKAESEFGHKIFVVDRDPSTATDTASTESAMLDFSGKYEFEHMILIQATSPLLETKHLAGAIDFFEQGDYDSLLSVVRQKRFNWAQQPDGSFASINYDYNNRPRRQEFDGYLVENGAFYITRKDDLERTKCRLSGRIGAYEMPEETYFEIDEPSDWVVIEHFMNRRNKSAKKGAKQIRLFVTDCDGCLTDGGMYYSENGDEMKKFNTLDGMGLALLHAEGIKTAIITGENTKMVERRGNKLKVDYIYQGIKDKVSVLKEIAEKEGIRFEEIAYMGDDINDVECLKAVGMSFSVPNGTDKAKEAADYIVSRPGGKGAVREAVEMILGK